jgi:pectate lyase
MLKGKETAIGDIDSKVDFDAYVVSNRDAQVPSSIKSYAGENVYNNFDTDKAIMYSYTAESPEQAVANVRAYAGRVQGGDFKWMFDNSVDDASSEVNQKLKDALMAYKGSNGEVMEYPSSSSTSISSSSSSEESVDISSSSEGTTAFAMTMPTSQQVFYDSRSAQLVIGSSEVSRLQVVGVDGRRVDIAGLKKVGDARVLDLSSLRAGIYIVRASTTQGLLTKKIVKN